MRRKDREITNPEQIMDILKTHNLLRLGLCKNNQPYIVPMNFGFAQKQGKLYLYMHGAGQGKKIDYIQANPNVCFEMDQNHQIVQDASPQNWTAHYTSIVGFGKIKILTQAEEKLAGLSALMLHCGYKGPLSLPQSMLAQTCVLQLTVEEISAKANPAAKAAAGQA